MKLNLKKMIIINSIVMFAISFLVHSLYNWIPNNIIAVFFPVNESIWEHMKMLYTTNLLSSIIEYIILKKNDIEYHNFLLVTYLKSILIIPLYLLMFLPLYYNIGENMIIAISVMLISMVLINILGYYLLQTNDIKYQKIISILLIIFTYVIMGILTFKTPRMEIFFDTHEEKYGINDYLIKK